MIFFQENYIKKTLILLKINKIILISISEISDKYYKINEKEIFIKKSYKYLQFINNIMYRIIQTYFDYIFQILYFVFFS